MMGASRWVENPLYILREEESLNLLLIPFAYCLLQVFLTPYETATIVGLVLLWLSHLCDRPPQRVQEKVCIQTVNNFNMNGSYHHAGEQYTISLYSTSSSSHFQWPKTIYNNIAERGL